MSSAVTSDELLTKLVAAGRSMVELARVRTQVSFRYGDVSGWNHPTPLRWQLQVCHLMVQSIDGFDLAMAGLERRTSPASLGPIRIVAEAYVYLKWIVDGGSDDERQIRAAAMAKGMIEDLGRIGASDDPRGG